ncbi:hypothetical protein FBT69_03550 [Synechococcales cyanobacterium CNB]|nr:hypothetical protein [Leptolyngbya sp.]MCQ3939617.1 hypothetical protein [cyanobacterium CYA1]MCZ7632139.1 hypothetical protein [Phycisphaerales bacterium]MDL1903873.1 hypothetical protein [Synechococcales cyanobacterium CNB]
MDSVFWSVWTWGWAFVLFVALPITAVYAAARWGSERAAGALYEAPRPLVVFGLVLLAVLVPLVVAYEPSLPGFSRARSGIAEGWLAVA